jgi:hypothetical protein
MEKCLSKKRRKEAEIKMGLNLFKRRQIEKRDSLRNKYNFYNLRVIQNEYFGRIYKNFKKQYGGFDSVLYPCCFLDSSPSLVFKNVTYVENDPEAVKLLKKAGFNAICSDIKLYSPKEKHDLLILVNPALGVSLHDVARHLKKDAYLLTDSGLEGELRASTRKYSFCGNIYDPNENNNPLFSMKLFKK